MTLKYESEILFDLMKRDGDDAPSDVLPYESELKEKYLHQVEGAYPKLQDYRPEWLNYNLNAHLPADFPVESVSNVTNATFENVVPYAYRSAILKGSTKYRDIDTGEILESFEEGRNLELVSVKMPVLTTVGKNLFDKTKITKDYVIYSSGELTKNIGNAVSDYIKIEKNKTYIKNSHSTIAIYDVNKIFIKRLNSTNVVTASNDGYIRCNIGDYANTVDSLQIEEGSVATSYEPYKSNILTVNEEVELRGIGKVQDTLDCLTGEVVERVGEIVLDGSEEWQKNSSDFNSFYYRHNESLSFSKIITDNYPIINSFEDKTNGIFKGGVAFGIIKNDIENVEQLKQWLSENPITVQYQLATESIKTVGLTVTDHDGNTESIIRPIEGRMHVSTSSQTLLPLLDMSVPVEATSQNLMSFANILEEE